MRLALAIALCELPDWLTQDFVWRVLESKIFSAIWWAGAAVVAIIGFIAKRKYRDKNLKTLLDRYLEKAKREDGTERKSVKEVISRAIRKAQGLRASGSAQVAFNPSDVFENAARFFAQSQSGIAIQLMAREADICEATIEHAEQQVKRARERAATAYLEIGSMHRSLGKGSDALDAFLAMLRVNPNDLDALRMLGVQCRDLKRYEEAERYFNTLFYYVSSDPAAAADIKRELAGVFLGKKDYTRAEAVLGEAMKIEEERASQRGIATTHERIGSVLAARTRWKLARESFRQSKVIFESLDDTESAASVQASWDAMEAARKKVLEQRRARRSGGFSVATVH